MLAAKHCSLLFLSAQNRLYNFGCVYTMFVGFVAGQCDHILCIFLSKLPRFGGITPSCSKCCKSLKQGGIFNPTGSGKKYTRSGHIGATTRLLVGPCKFLCAICIYLHWTKKTGSVIVLKV